MPLEPSYASREAIRDEKGDGDASVLRDRADRNPSKCKVRMQRTGSPDSRERCDEIRRYLLGRVTRRDDPTAR